MLLAGGGLKPKTEVGLGQVQPGACTTTPCTIPSNKTPLLADRIYDCAVAEPMHAYAHVCWYLPTTTSSTYLRPVLAGKARKNINKNKTNSLQDIINKINMFGRNLDSRLQ